MGQEVAMIGVSRPRRGRARTARRGGKAQQQREQPRCARRFRAKQQQCTHSCCFAVGGPIPPRYTHSASLTSFPLPAARARGSGCSHSLVCPWPSRATTTGATGSRIGMAGASTGATEVRVMESAVLVVRRVREVAVGREMEAAAAAAAAAAALEQQEGRYLQYPCHWSRWL